MSLFKERKKYISLRRDAIEAAAPGSDHIRVDLQRGDGVVQDLYGWEREHMRKCSTVLRFR